MIGERLKELIELRGMTQAELARRMRVSPVSIHVWISNKGYPRIYQLANMCEELECSADYLLGLSDKIEMNTTRKGEKEL